MKPMKLLWLILISSSLLGNVTHAEGNCPAGYYPIGASQGNAGPQGCAPIPGYNQNQKSPQTQPMPFQWESQWGAIATDVKHKTGGASLDQPTQDRAIKAAIIDCRNNGGSTCKIELSYGNGCAVMVGGDTGHNAKAGRTINEATALAMRVCNASDTRCQVAYSACSLPTRIR